MKISILSAVYNESRHVEQMIDSVRAQKHSDWELLFVDDGSTDGTPELASRAAETDPRVVLVSHGRRLGKVGAFNLAYRASTGAVVVLLAGDDVLPPDSLRHRAEAFTDDDLAQPVVAYFKLRTFSEKRRYDGAVLPRGAAGSRSGGCITMTRPLAELVFPVDETLDAEDVWLSHAADALAARTVQRPEIVLHYRIHDANSHVRDLPFHLMSEMMRSNHQAYRALLDAERLHLPQAHRDALRRLCAAEELRYAGRTWRLLAGSGLPVPDRLALAAMSDPLLYAVRSRLFRFLSGRRGR